jgi:hypothetical protein
MSRYLSAVMSACLAAVVVAAPAADDQKPAAADAERLVRQLGSSKHADREAAAKALDSLGAAALPALREGVKNTDPEIRRRAGDLLAKVDRAAESAAALAPTKVRLKVSDAPLAEVIRDLGKQANVRFQLAREPVDLAGRRVTLDTGDTTFWEALEAVCRTAKVSLRPSIFDPSADDPASGPVAINGGFGALPGGAIMANGAVMFNTSTGYQAEEPLVLQDGAMPAYPFAVLGAVRVRLIPDRWANRDRKAGDEVRWTLEILTEPRVRWVGQPSFRFDSRHGLRVDATPQNGTGNPVPPVNRRVMLAAPGGIGMVGPNARGVTRYELPAYVKADAAIDELKGTLAGPVQAPAGAVATIADVSKEKASAATKDGTKVTVKDYSKADDGAVTLTLELERPAAVGVFGGGGAVINRAGRVAGGAIPVQIARMIAGADGMLESVKLTDEKGRPYELAITKSEMANRNGAMTGTLTLECQAAAADSKPVKLEVLGPRSMNVEAAFTLRNVLAVP